MAKRTRLDWLAWSPVDFLTDQHVRKMTPLEIGAYVLLLNESWLQKPCGTLPKKENELMALAKCSQDEWSSVKNAVLARWKSGKGGRLYHKRLRKEYLEAKKRHDTAKELSSRRWSKGTCDGTCDGISQGTCNNSTVHNSTIHNITSNQSELDILAPAPVPAPARGEAGLTADAVPSAEPSETETERIKRNAGPAIEQVVMWMRNGTGARQDVLYTQIAREWLRSGTWKELQSDRWCGMAQNYATRLVDVKRYQAERVMFCWACCELTDNCACKGQERGKHYQSIRVPAGTKHSDLPKWILDNATMDTQP